MTNLDTGKKVAMFRNARTGDMVAIIGEMNRLNQEAARIMGKAVKYSFSIAFKVISK